MAEGQPHLFHITSGISHALAEAVLEGMNPALGVSGSSLLTVSPEHPVDLNP